MRCAIAHPCSFSVAMVRMMSRSSVPWTRSVGFVIVRLVYLQERVMACIVDKQGVLVTGCWLLVAGCWLLVAGCWLLVPTSAVASNQSPVTSHQSPVTTSE